MEQPDQKQHKPFKSRLVLGILHLLAALPVSVAKILLRPITWLQILLPNRGKQVTELNLEYCNIDVPGKSRRTVRNQAIIHSTNLLAEFSLIWTHDYADKRRLITQVSIDESFNQTEEGKLLISPHLGNWELVWAFLSNEFGCAGMYKPAKISDLDDLMLEGRGGVAMSTDTRGVRKILKWLKEGGSFFLLPDQQPPEGSGVFADFFGQPAYTMTLLHGLLKRTNTTLWMALAIDSGSGYELSIYPLEVNSDVSPEEFNTAMNKTMEEAIMKAPEQYQWSYKRFKKTIDGAESIYTKEGV